MDLTEEERKVSLEAFNEADRDGSGELDFEEFFLLLKRLYPTVSLPDANKYLSIIYPPSRSDTTVHSTEYTTGLTKIEAIP